MCVYFFVDCSAISYYIELIFGTKIGACHTKNVPLNYIMLHIYKLKINLLFSVRSPAFGFLQEKQVRMTRTTDVCTVTEF